MQTAKADHSILREIPMYFKKTALVEDLVDDRFHIVSLAGISGHDGV